MAINLKGYGNEDANFKAQETMRLIVAILAITTLVLGGCETPRATQAIVSDGGGMSPSVVWRYNRSTNVDDLWRGRQAISVIIPVAGRKCGPAVNLLRPSERQREEPLTNIALMEDCEASSDGLAPHSAGGNLLIRQTPRDASMRLKSSKGRWKGKDRASMESAGELLAMENRYEPDQVDGVLLQCEDRCPSAIYVATYFAKANYFESISRSLTSAVWRLEGLEHALHSDAFLSEHSSELTRHLKAAYDHADNVSDFRVAKWVYDEWDQHLSSNDSEALDNVREHLKGWEESLEQRDAPNGYTFPLVTDTPVSDYHAVTYRGLATREFKIDVLEGSIEYAFLQCGDWLLKAPSGRQVELHTDETPGWKVPSDWGNCGLIILGEQDSEIRVWEYPDGSLDENGNLSA